MYRRTTGDLQVLLVHPGGPFWQKKDDGAWTIPKGEVESSEDELAAARREFREETGLDAVGEMIPLGSAKHKSGKVVTAWAFEGDCDPTAIKSNTFSIEWPPKSGQKKEFPEVDRACFFRLAEARQKIMSAELPLLDALPAACGVKTDERPNDDMTFPKGLFG